MTLIIMVVNPRPCRGQRVIVSRLVCFFVTSESTHLDAISTGFTAWIAFAQQVIGVKCDVKA